MMRNCHRLHSASHANTPEESRVSTKRSKTLRMTRWSKYVEEEDVHHRRVTQSATVASPLLLLLLPSIQPSLLLLRPAPAGAVAAGLRFN